MTTTRRWKTPTTIRKDPMPTRGGTMVWHITDTHIGEGPGYAYPRMNAVGDGHQLYTKTLPMVPDFHGYVHTGDIVNDSNADTDPEDANALTWFNKYFSDKPNVWCPGNHDIWKRTNGQTSYWETAYGRNKNQIVTIGSGANQMKIMGFAPDVFLQSADAGPDTPTSDLQWTMSAATLDWMDQQLTLAGSTPVIMCTHFPLAEQTNHDPATNGPQPHDQIINLISSHSNAAMWLSGHFHWNTEADQRMAVVKKVGSRNRFPMVCGPSTRYAGSYTGQTNPDTNAPYPGGQGMPYRCCIINYLGDMVEVWYRDYGASRWAEGWGTPRVSRLPLVGDRYTRDYRDLY